MQRASVATRRVVLAGFCLACIAALHGVARYVRQGPVQPLSLASADINLDGFPDLISGHAVSGGGVVTLRLGNPEAFAPTRRQTIQAIANGQYPSPFVSETTVFETPEAPEFLAAGDFDRDGHLDILTAARGSGALYMLPGDGNHGFGTPRAVSLPGRLTAMTTGQKTQTDGWPDVVVGIVGDDGPALIVYETKHGVLASAAPIYALPAAVSEVALGQLDEDRSTDLAIVAGDRLFVLHGPDYEASGEVILQDEEEGGYLEPIALPFGVNAVAVSDFIWDRDARMELAVAADDGAVRILAQGPLDTRPLTAREVLARRHVVEAVRRGERPLSDLAPARPYRVLTWQVEETIATGSSQRAGGAHPLLVSTLGSGRQSHDLLIPESGVVAALPMRVSVHALPGLVVLRQGDAEPVVQVPQSHAAFTVNTTADTDDAAAGNGTCADSGGNCSLRAAVQEANAHAGADMITFSPALNGVPIQLMQVGDDNTAAQGDLDINSDITIVGNGVANTIIQGASNAAFTGNMGDKIFGINQAGTFSTLNVSISGVTVRFTRNDNPAVGTFTETGGAMDIFLTGTGAMPGPTTTITNCTFDSNANLNSYGGAINIDSGDLTGGTNIFRGTVQITGSTISNNDTLNVAAAVPGGGINLFADRHNVTFTNTTITGNQTSANIGSNGGGLNIRHSFGGTITLNTVTISNNISGSDGGGILIAGVGGQTVNITGGSITGNTAQGTGASADGGGLFNGNPVGSTTLTNVTISNNIATAGANARGGGIEDGANSPLTINNCVITGNSSDNGGGVATTNAFVNQLTTITNSTISGNSATTAGGALFVLSGSLMANLNRIMSNTAPSGSGIAQTGGTANVENNWWGCDGFPNSAGCQTGSGTFDADPRIDLRLLPASATLGLGGTQTFTADVSQNTSGAAINPVVLNGLTVTFSGGGLGSVSPGSAALTNLMAGTLFTASSTCPIPNTGNVSATLDNGTQNSSMTVQVPPMISACPANQTVNTDPGTCTALVSFTPPTATAGCPAPTVTVRIGATPITSPHAFPVGTSTATSTASNGVAPDASCSFTVTVNDTENPAISCPANVTATENPPGSGSAVVTYAAPVGTDACPGATTVQTAGLPSGNAFPVGVTTNTFRVTDAAGNMATCSFNVTVTVPPDLSITKSHTGNFTQGQTGATYTLTVTNSGGMPTSGAVTLADSVPPGLVPTAASGAGWTCGVAGAMVNCSRSDPLAPGASYGPVTLTVDVAPNAPPSVTNIATVSGGGDVNTANNTASDVTTIIPGPDLIIAKNHAGNFIQGQTGAQFTVTVTNSGGAPTSGTVTLIDSVPTGLIPTAASGTGWNCGVTGAMVNCTRSDPLAPGASYGPVTITVNVAPNAPPSVTNIATVSGGGDVNATNNTATDVTTILPGPDLIVSKSHIGNFIQGQTGAQFTVTVTNSGGSPTSGTVTLADTPPTGLIPTTATGAGWTCGVAGATVNCTRSEPLIPGASYPALTITVNVAPNAPPSVTNTATIAGGSEVNATNNTATDVVAITPGPDLIISKSHVGSFVAGQTGAQFAVTVSNSGGSPTSGVVTVVDSLPTVLVPTAASGAGWTCGVTGSTVTCTRSDPLAPGAGYGPITVTVDVAISAPSSATNTAAVSGGGDVNPANNTAMDSVTIEGTTDLAVTKTDGQPTYVPGAAITYTLTVTNGGPATATAFSIVDAVPAVITGVTVGCAVVGSGTCGTNSSVGNSVSFTNASLAPDALLTVTISGVVLPTATGDLVNTATVTPGVNQTDPSLANNTATDADTQGSANPPTISTIADQTIGEDTATAALAFTIADPDGVGTVTVTASSSDPTLLPNANLVLGGADANRTLTATPAANRFGTAIITLTATDGTTTVTSTFTLTVTPVADTPSVTGVTTPEDQQSTSGLVITANAADGPEVTHVKITAITDGTLFLNDGVTPIANGQFITIAQGAAGLKFTPSSNVDGHFTVQASLSASDAGLGGAPVTATITVLSVIPTIASITPATGPPAGGTPITIVGTNFTPGATVTIGGLAATSVVVVDATTITAVTPAHAAGTVDVMVTVAGPRSVTRTGGFQYLERRLTVTTIGAGTGRVISLPAGLACGAACSALFPTDALVELVAIPAADSTFAGWTGAADCADGRVTLTTDTTCTARFARLPDRTGLDLDGDGYGDLVAYAPPPLSIAAGSLFGGRVFVTPSTGVLRAGDFNGDGRSDLFEYDPVTGVWSVALAGGGSLSGVVAARRSPITIELDGDGRTDLALVDPVTGEIQLCAATAFPVCALTLFAPAGAAIYPLDADGDGRGDLLAYVPATGQLQFLLSGATPALGPLDADITVLDVDGDRRSDLVFYNAVTGAATLSMIRSVGLASGSGMVGPGWTVRRAQLTYDGFDDLVAYHPASGVVLQLRSNGDGTFVISSSSVLPNRQFSVADLNADGLSDSVFYDAASGATTVGIAGGDGSSIWLPLSGPPGLTLLMQGGFTP
jgi:CSLREA domain-containing protein/uncharacterized repeat protein (TIGR01451 family)